MEVEQYMVCTFCRSKFQDSRDVTQRVDSHIGLKSDVDELLKKCESDPLNRARYIRLILDIDPGNSEVRKYMQAPKKKKWWQ